MNGNDLMLAICAAGFALALLYCVVEYLRWRSVHAADRISDNLMSAIYAKIFSVEKLQRAARDLVAPLTTLTGQKRK